MKIPFIIVSTLIGALVSCMGWASDIQSTQFQAAQGETTGLTATQLTIGSALAVATILIMSTFLVMAWRNAQKATQMLDQIEKNIHQEANR